jgi:tetratricopeptide (TPR) repeat protein
MSRGWKIAIGCVVLLLVVGILGLWGIWVATGRGAPIYSTIAWMYEDSQSYPAAAQWYGRAVRAKPGDAQLRYELGNALWQSGDARGALQEYEEAARLEPTWSWPLIWKATAHTYLNEFDEAQSALDEALALSPRDPHAHVGIGRLRAAEKKPEEAIEAFEKAVDLDPNLGGAYAELGQVLEDEGETDRAIEVYEKGAARGNHACRDRLVALGHTPPAAGPMPSAGAPGTGSGSTPPTSPGGTSGTGSTGSGSGAPPPAFFGMMGGFLIMYFLFIMFAVVLSMGSLVVTLLAIYDCARRDFPDPTTRAMWCLLIAFTKWIGALIYYFLVYHKDDPPLQHARTLAPTAPMDPQT